LLEVAPRILIREDRDAAARIQDTLEQDGMSIFLGCNIRTVKTQGAEKLMIVEQQGVSRELRVDAILLGSVAPPTLKG